MKKILIQFDTDVQPSVFDRVVAVDAGAEQLFSYGNTTPETVTGLVHGAMFTRGPQDLKNTAIFVGGGSAAAGEALTRAILKTFFGPMRVSVMMDSNGCNTTAAAAVALARKHHGLQGVQATVLGGTGPVGLRAAELLAAEGASVRLVSRSADRAAAACDAIASRHESAALTPIAAETNFVSVCAGSEVVISAGAAGVCFLPEGSLLQLNQLKIAIDLNAVPPTGMQEIELTDKAVERDGTLCFGALGVGGLKMKVHRSAISSLFESNDKVMDTAAIYQLACELAGSGS